MTLTQSKTEPTVLGSRILAHQPRDTRELIADILGQDVDPTASGLRGQIMAHQPRDTRELIADILGWE